MFIIRTFYFVFLTAFLNEVRCQLSNLNGVVQVKTSEGTVVGFKEIDGEYYGFYGVPYGGKSSGEFRFKAAPPPSQYEELIANKTDILCAQPSPSGLRGVEDCLTLSIFTKNVHITNPVIVWIGGEDFSDSISTRIYSYKTLVESDLVVVEVNYRLSVFGFLCLGVEDAPGNAGLKDVVQALNWIKNNIKPFGGDPNNIILLGHGSGAAVVDIITLNDQSKDLFHKAIALSGSALSPWAIAYNPEVNAKSLGLKLGLLEISNHNLTKFLVDIDSEKLVKVINTFESTNQALLFAPCVENSKLTGGLLRTAPNISLKSGNYKAIPYIAGFVTNEGTLRLKEALDNGWLNRMQDDFSNFLPVNLKLSDAITKSKLARELRNYYFGNQTITNASIEAFLQYEGESLIQYPMIKTIKERAKVSDDSIRLFRFDYQQDDMSWDHNGLSVKGPSHGSLLSYIFDIKSKNVDSKPKQILIERFVKFAKTGKPKGYIDWMPATPDNDFIFVIDGNKSSFGVHNDMEGFTTKAPWDDIMEKYYREPISAFSSARKLALSFLLIVICQILV